MSAETTSIKNAQNRYLRKIAPGLADLLNYRRSDLSHDLVAGLSVAAVALPVGVAYAQLAGFNPAVGLYSSILPLLAYAVFGTSRQLIVGPDAATCALVSAAVAPLASGNQDVYQSLSVTLALLAGVLCIGASFLKLGVLADFLSKPILVGFLNGIALNIIFGQIGKLFGFPINAEGIVPRMLEFAGKLRLTHGPTLAVGMGALLILALSSRFLRRVPSAFVAIISSAAAVRFLNLENLGVKTVGDIPAGLPHLKIPHFPIALLPNLVGDAVGLALVTFASMMLTSRSFASKHKYDVDADREFVALGAANISSALSEGFAVSGADSRTAMSDSVGGRTQVTGLVAAATVGAVLLFFTGPLRYVPIAALGAVLIKAALSLVDISALRTIFKIDRREFGLSVLSTLGVVAVGAIQAILIVVILAVLRFVRLVSRPQIEILGEVAEGSGFHSVGNHPEAVTMPGLILFRFNGPIVFFNAPYFKRAVVAAGETPDLKWLVLDMLPITMVDATGLFTMEEVANTLRERGVVLAVAGRQKEWRLWAEAHRVARRDCLVPIYCTMSDAVEAYRHAGHVSVSVNAASTLY